MVDVSGAHGIVAWRTNTSNNFLLLVCEGRGLDEMLLQVEQHNLQ
jgi:hypothetical protein